MKRSEYDRPPHPKAERPPIFSTWRCPRCKVIRGVQTGWKVVGKGKEKRRICIPCWELTQ